MRARDETGNSFFVLMSLLVIGLVGANPIPVPTILMPEEHIAASISMSDEDVVAKVDGEYSFSNIGYENTTMYYPVPPEATNISVEINGTLLSWTYSGTFYSTVIGDFPLIKWIVSPTPNKFTVKTHYEHSVPQIDEYYMFLHAMGTGRYLEYWAKETTAYVKVTISKDVTRTEEGIKVYTIELNEITDDWIWHPANYTIIEEINVWTINLTKTTELFEPLEEDLLVMMRTDWWMPYIPSSDQVDLRFWMENQISYVSVTITCPVWALDVSEWGVVARKGNDFWVDSEVWFLISDVYLQVVQVLSHTYDLGHLEEGNYTFTFSVWSLPVKSISFTVGMPGDINYDGKVNIEDLAIVGLAFGSYPSHPRWNPTADVNYDDKINIEDMAFVASHFGEIYQQIT